MVKAITATFDRRSTAIGPLPERLKEDFGKDKPALWTVFLRRARLAYSPSRFGDTLRAVRKFARPALSAAASSDPFERNWRLGSSWSVPPRSR